MAENVNLNEVPSVAYINVRQNNTKPIKQEPIYCMLPSKTTPEAYTDAYHNAQEIQYEIGRDMANEAHLREQQYNMGKKVSLGVTAGGGVVTTIGAVGAVKAATVGGIAAVTAPAAAIVAGTGLVIGGAVGLIYNSRKENEANSDKNNASAYANDAAPGAERILPQEPEAYITEPKNEYINNTVHKFINEDKLQSEKITYLAITESSSDNSGNDTDYSKFEVDVKAFDSKSKLEGDGKEKNGFKNKTISFPKEFATFAKHLLTGKLNENKVRNADKIIGDISQGKFNTIDINGDGHINDYDKYVMEKIVKNTNVEEIKNAITQKLPHTELPKFDINGDGFVDEKDVEAYNKLLANKSEIADINADGVADDEDLSLLSKYETSIANYYGRLSKDMKTVEEHVGNGTLNGKTLQSIAERARQKE